MCVCVSFERLHCFNSSLPHHHLLECGAGAVLACVGELPVSESAIQRPLLSLYLRFRVITDKKSGEICVLVFRMSIPLIYTYICLSLY